MRKRLRKKRHREFLTTVCAYVVTFDDGLRDRLLRSEPGTPFPINSESTAIMKRLIRGHGLRYWVKVGRMVTPATAVVVYWADEFPSIRDEAVIFSAAELGLTDREMDRRARAVTHNLPDTQGGLI
jgi:hypothetical protein